MKSAAEFMGGTNIWQDFYSLAPGLPTSDIDYKKMYMSHNDSYIQEWNDLNVMLEFMFCTTEQVYILIHAKKAFLLEESKYVHIVLIYIYQASLLHGVQV